MGGVRAVLTVGILGAMLAATAAAQQQRAELLIEQQKNLQVGSCDWFRIGCEIVDAQAADDVSAMLATARRLWAEAEHSAVPGAAATTAALLCRTLSIGEGPTAAREWFERAGSPANDTPLELRVHHLLSTAYYLCACDDHVGEAQLALQVIELLADHTEPRLTAPRIRALAMATHVKGERGLADLEAGFTLATQLGHEAEILHLRPLVVIEHRNQAAERGDDDSAARLDHELETMATAQGNRRLLGLAIVHRANRLYVQGRQQEAMPLYDRSEQLYRELGDLRMLFGALCFRARHALSSGNDADSGHRIDELLQLIDGRGFRGEDRALLQLRFDRAMSDRDIDLASELQRQMEIHDRAIAEEDRRSAQLRHDVAQAVEAKTRAEELLRQQREATDAHERAVRTSLGLVALASLLVLSSIFWWSRRRFAAANARLAAQMRELRDSEQAQRRLEERMRALERSEILGRMAAGVAHDFNNILTSILGSAELLRTAPDRAAIDRLSHTIVSSSEQASRMCRHLQSYAGGSPPALERLDLCAVASDLLPTLHAAAGGAAIVRVAATATPTGALADRVEIEQLLLNLAQNAKDAGAKTIEIDITATPDGSARIAVRDDGHGMSPEVQRRIFDPFFTTRFPGRGLGLAVVHGIVRRHQGRIEVDSAPGRGSTFSILLPGAALPEPTVVIPRSAATPALPTGPSRLCIVVDDEPEVRRLLHAMLESLDQPVRAFASGDELCRALPSLPMAAQCTAFLDLTMPGMDGVETMRRLRAARPDIRVVLASGHPPDYVDELARGAAPDRVLAKPFTRAALADALAAAAAPAPLASATAEPEPH